MDVCAVCEFWVYSKVRPRTFGCVAMGIALLFIVRSRLLVYSAGSGVNRVQVVLSGFSKRLQGTKRITGQYSLLRTSAPQEVLVRTGQHWSVYTREASEIFKLSGC